MNMRITHRYLHGARTLAALLALGLLLSYCGGTADDQSLVAPGNDGPALGESRSGLEMGQDTNFNPSAVYQASNSIKGYVLTHEHPVGSMSFGGNYAFAGTSSSNWQHGVMKKGYTSNCGGCGTLGNCSHGEVKGSFGGLALGGDMGDHSSHKGPYSDSISHMRYSTDWIKEAFRPASGASGAGRMRVMVAYALENELMCETLYHVGRKSSAGINGYGWACQRGDSYTSLRRQIIAIKNWAAANSSWMEVAYDADDARRIANQDKLVIIIGIEADYAFGSEKSNVDPVSRLNAYHNLGVRTFYLAHKINSRLAGADIYGPADTQGGKAMRGQQAGAACFYVDDHLKNYPWDPCNHTKCSSGGLRFNGFTNACNYRWSQISEVNTASILLSPPSGFDLYPTGHSGFTYYNKGSGGSHVETRTYGSHNVSTEVNRLGLSTEGRRVLNRAMDLGMLMSLDHVSSQARRDIYNIAGGAGGYPLNAFHNRPNHRIIRETIRYRVAGTGVTKKHDAAGPHEYDFENSELDMIKNTGGFFGLILGPVDSKTYPNAFKSSVDYSKMNCEGTSTELAKVLAWLIDRGVNVGYSLDFATVTKGALSRTARAGYSSSDCTSANDKLQDYRDPATGLRHRTDGLQHIGMMRQWHRELTSIGMKDHYVEQLRDDSAEQFIRMWERTEQAAANR